MKSALYLGQFSKIKVSVHWTFLLLILYIIYSGLSSGLSGMAIAWNILFILTLFVCVLLHEFGHALTGKRFGFKTKDIILLPIGGVARFEKLPETPKQEFLVAIAGPMVNFLIAFVLHLLTQPGIHYFLSLDISSINADNFLTFLWIANLSIGLFNLIPAFPMDGGRILRALLSIYLTREKATRLASSIGSLFAVGFILLGFVQNPFLIVIGIFILISASSETSIVRAQSLLADHSVSEIIIHDYPSLNENTSIAEASKAVLNSTSSEFMVVANDNTIKGMVNRDQIIKSLTDMNHEAPLSEITTKATQTIPATTLLKDLYTSSILRKNTMVPVSDRGEIIGVINLDNIHEFLAIKQATPLWKSLIPQTKPGL